MSAQSFIAGSAGADSAAAADPTVVALDGFGKHYGHCTAVDGISLHVRRGQLYGLIGADGAGKSSVLKAIAGVLIQEQGTVEVFGRRIESEHDAEQIKGRIGFMPQGLGLNLYPELSIDENIDFFGRLREVPAAPLRERKELLLSMTRLTAFRGRATKHLSGGMKQKLGLVCTLVHSPELIILDEPTTGVDPVSRRDFWVILTQLLERQGFTALVSTAYLDEASRFDRLALMHGGRVLAEGEPQALADAAGAWIVQASADVEAQAALARSFPQIELRASRARVYVPASDRIDAERLVREAATAGVLGPLTTAHPDLEDLFVARMREISGERGLKAAPVVDGAVVAADGSSGCAIDAQSLTRDFGSFRAVDQVSFAVHYGEIFGLLGANGAGKTTAIKMLTGILPPSSGIGRVAGADMRRAQQAIKEHIGYMSQSFSLYTDLTVIENLLLFAGVYGLNRKRARERAQWAIALGGLEGFEHDYAGRLPMGLRQRLALGCALIHGPRVLFLDEPTSGVDPLGRRRFWEILQRLAREQSVAILLTTHYMREADLCDRVALMFAGRIVADATPSQMKAELVAERGQLLELSVASPLSALTVLHDAGFGDAALHGRHLHVMAHGAADAEARIRAALAAAGQAPAHIAAQELTMEDVFLHRILALEAATAGGRAA